MSRLIRIPGGRLAAETPREAAQLAAGAGWLLGAPVRRMSQAGRSGDRALLHQLERRWALAVSDFLGIKLDVTGRDHIVAGRRTIVVPLHEGFVDAVALLRLDLDLRFVASGELFEWPTLGRYLRNTSQVLINTSRPPTAYRQLLRSGRVVLDGGEAMVMFPQGSILGIEVAFWRGAFRLAEQLDAWVLPVVLTGSHRVWEYPFSPLVRFDQPMSMRILAPIAPGQAGAEARALEVEMKRIALHESVAPARRFVPEIDGYWDDYRYSIDPSFPGLAAQVASHRELLTR